MFKQFKLLAIDASSKKSGISYFTNGKYQEHCLIDCSYEKNMDIRFQNMAMKLWETLDKYKPNLVYIEETVVLRNAQTQRFLTRLQGIVYAWCMKNKCEFDTIRPTSWRAAIGIKQNKNIKRNQLKEQAIIYVFNKYGLKVNDDEAEAIYIGDAVTKLYGDDK